MRYYRLLLALLIFTVGFNIWHISKHGLWDPPTFIDSLNLSKDCAQRFSKFDPSLRPSINGHYDGQWFYMGAYDPFILHPEYEEGYDSPRYRHNRVLYSLLTHIIALGRPTLYPYVLFALAIASYIFGAVVTYQLCKTHGWTSWVVIGYLTNTGILYSAFRDMSEPMGVTLTLLGLFYWERRKRIYAISSFAAAALTKEIFIIAPLALYFWDWWKGRGDFRKACLASIVTLGALLAWMAYVAYRIPHDNSFAAVPIACPSFGIGRFSLPFVSLFQETLYGAFHATTRTVFKLTLSISIVTVMIIIISFLGFFRRPTMWSTILAIQGLFLSCTRGEIWNYYASSSRQTAILFVFFFFWLADEMRKISPQLYPKQISYGILPIQEADRSLSLRSGQIEQHN